MALSIGNVNFGVDANTAGLRKAIAALDAFQRKTNQVAKSQSAQAQATARAMARQESAIKNAFQQTLRLHQQLRRVGGPEATRQIADASRAFGRLTKEMTSGRLSAVEFTRSMDAFTAKMGRVRRALSDLKAQETERRLNKLAQVIRNLESASVLAVGPLSGLGSRIRAIASITNRSTLALAAFFGTVAGGTVALIKLSNAAINAHKVFEQTEARFLATSGSMDIARKEMAFVIQTANELGLRIDTSAKAFSRLVAATRGTSLEGEGVRKIFEGVSKAAAALRLGNLEVEGTFRAIEQMISKGSVQAEELRGQLGERLPGAFRLAAESMGLTTRQLGEMLQRGEILADEFLPRFVAALEEAFGARAKDNVNSFQGALNILSNEALLFSKRFDEITQISTVAVGAIQAVSGTFRFLRENMVVVAKILGAVGGAMVVLAGPMIISGIVALGKAFVGLARAIVAVNIAMLANPIGRVATWIVKLTAVIGGAIAGWLGMEKVIGDVGAQLDELDATLDTVARDALTNIGTLSEGFKELKNDVMDTAKELQVYTSVLTRLNNVDPVTPVRQAFGELGPLSELTVDKVLSLASAVSGPLTQAYEKALATAAKATEPKELLRLFETMHQVMEMNGQELAQLARQLSTTLGRDVARDAFSVTLALHELQGALDDAQEAFNRIEARTQRTKDVFRDVSEQLGTMTLRLHALREGPEAVQFFDAVTSKVRDFRMGMEGTNISMEVRNQLTETFRNLLVETIALEEEHERQLKAQQEAERALEKAMRDRQRRMERIQEVLGETHRHFGDMQRKLAAIAQGPRSLQVFEEVEEPLARMRDRLIEAGIPMTVINQELAEYETLLRRMLHVQNIATGAAKQTSDAIINGLENMITLSESVSDSLRQLANELFRIFLRATLLDPLRDSLIGAFTGLFSGRPSGPTGPLGPPRQHGGNVRPGMLYPVGEKGIEFFEPAVSGRIIPNSALGAMGGGVNLTINAPGADAGTVARITEIVRTELGPQMVKAATENTMNILRRPRFA